MEWNPEVVRRVRGAMQDRARSQACLFKAFSSVMTREQAEQAQKDTAAGKTVELPKQAVKLATATFTTNKAGDYLISSSDEDKPVAQWKAEDGVDLTNLPSGYATFVFDIANKDQDTESQTGIKPS